MTPLDVVPGDTLIVEGRLGGRDNFYKFERLTKTLAVCEGDNRFNLKDGSSPGSHGRFGYMCSRDARKATACDLLNQRITKAQAQIQKFIVSAENLDAVKRLLEMSFGKAGE